MGFALQLAEEGVLLGEQDLDVLHADRDHPGADVGVQRVDALGEKEEGRMMDVVNADRSTRLKITRGVSLEDWCACLGCNKYQHLNQTHSSEIGKRRLSYLAMVTLVAMSDHGYRLNIHYLSNLKRPPDCISH